MSTGQDHLPPLLYIWSISFLYLRCSCGRLSLKDGVMQSLSTAAQHEDRIAHQRFTQRHHASCNWRESMSAKTQAS